MRFDVLGPLAVTDDAGRPLQVTGAYPRGVLAVLLLNANQPVSVDRLSHLLWGDRPPNSVVATLRNHVLRLRKALQDPDALRVQTDAAAYRIRVEPGELDADDFARWCAEGHRAVGERRWPDAAASLARALELWRGEPLADLPALSGLEAHVRKLSEDRLLAYEGRIEADLHLGRHRSLTTELRELTSAHPLHETFHRQLMLALYRSGRRADALEAYRTLRRILIHELGVEPSGDVRRLQQRMLDVDPALDLEPADPGTATITAATTTASTTTTATTPASPTAPATGTTTTATTAAPPPTATPTTTAAPPTTPAPVPVPVPGVFRQLPADLSTFTGRDKEVERLIDAATGAHEAATNGPLSPTVIVSAIGGMAGVGKTRLAVHTAHRLVRTGRFDEIQLYANLHGFHPDRPPADPSAVLDSFLRQLEVPAQQIPLSLEERAAMFRDRLHGRRSLILLDNAVDEEQVRSLIPAESQCLVLLTSRRTLAGLDGAELHLLDVFDPAEAVELLARIAGRDRVAAEPDVAADIVQACGYLPLAVSLAASRLRARPAWTLVDLAARLEDTLTATGVGGRSLSGVFELSYRGLTESAARAFRLLGVQPGLDFTAPALAALMDVAEAEAASILESLLDENLLQQRTAGRYEFHDLIRAFARQRGLRDEPAAERDAAFGRLMLWFAHSANNSLAAISPSAARPPLDPTSHSRTFRSRDEAMQWCRQELANMLACVTVAGQSGWPKLAWQTVTGFWAYFRVATDWDAWLDAYTAGLAAAEASHDLAGQSTMYEGLGTRCMQLGDFEQALRHFQMEYGVNIERGNPRSLAVALNNIGSLYFHLEQYETALDHFTRARAMKADDDMDSLLAMNIGETLGLLGRTEEAVRSLHEAEEWFLAKDDQYLAASTYAALGPIHLRAGEPAEAEAALRRAIEIRTTIGYRRGVASALLDLGETYLQTDRRALARESWQRALAVFTELDDQAGMAQARERLDSAL
ncbi:DNA-binding SARP family transcriptional activator/Tfp pilus assembly protein PilF [Catenulispora sp. EB89]|uniref:AfsR/SARP family transcriptional regulator n=1 Tax=Catenulispora sp. EB89 TaxID=3156257 RepID=UPI0035185DFE